MSGLWLALAVLLPLCGRAAGTWSALSNPAPGGVQLMLLLSDGTVMCQGGGTSWYRLTPDSHGSYVSGTWTTLASAHDSRRYFGSQVLRDGRVYMAGGEYGTGGGRMEIYDPVANTWTTPMTVPNGPIDSCTETLPNGNVLQGNAGSDTRVYDVTNSLYSVAITALGGQDEPSWVKLQDGSILTLTGTNSERFVPSLNKWVADASVPTPLFGYGYEIGAGVLLPNGKIFYIGGTNHTAIYTPWTTNSDGLYTPAGTTNFGSWVAGPDIPNNNGAVDAPAAMMVNGKVLCCMANSVTGFGSGSVYYEYDYLANAFTSITVPSAVSNAVAYGETMLDLPDGTVLVSGVGSTLYSYQPNGAPLTNGMPAILSVTTNLDGSFHLTGTLFNGISEGAYYGDDSQMNSDYPVARLTNGASTVYCRTYNWSTCNLMTGTNVVTTELALPAGMLAGTYPLVVTANGIASAPYSLTIAGTALPAVRSLAFTNISSSQMAFKWNAIGLSETGYVVQRSTNGVTFTTLALVSSAATNYTDSTVAPLGQYYYRVLGTNAFGLGLAPAPIFAASPPVTPVPAPWQSVDVGSVLGRGASGSNAAVFTVIGSGAGIGGTNDQFQFLGQPVAGDVTITARVTTNQNTGANALAAVMVRNSLDPAAAGAVMGYGGGSSNTQFQARTNAGASASVVNGLGGLAAPYWVRLVRSGNSLTGFTSPDGTTWTPVGAVSLVMEPVVYVGLAVGSGTYNLLNTSAFDNVTVSGTASASPVPLAYWKLDETGGATAQDSRANFDGTYSGAVLGQAGATPVTGYSAGFNGTSANVALPPLNLNSNVLTLTAWVNRSGNQSGATGLFFSRANATVSGLNFFNSTANELGYTWNGSSSTYNWHSLLIVPSNVWTFVALVIEPTRARLFMATNGVLVSATNSVANAVQAFDGASYIGQDSLGGRFFKGLLDEVQFYNQVLTPAQLAQLASTPAIVISAPVNGQEFLPPASLSLTADASATNGHVVNLVQFFNNGNLVGQTATPPYTNSVTNLVAGAYSFSARMFYDSGLVVSADPVGVVVETAPAVPQRVTATALASNLIYVSWAPSAGADGYVLNRGGVPLATLGGGTNYFVNTGLAAGSNYCYTVTATNQVGNSAASASACATTPGAASSLTWDASGSSAGPQDGSGSWDGVASTWWNGSTNTVWTDGLLAIFGSGTATNCTVSLTTEVSPAGLLFPAGAGGNYTLSNGGGDLNLTNSPVVTVSSSATISALVTGGGTLTKAGPGYLLLNNTNNFTDPVLVQGGTLEMASKSGDVVYTVTNGATLKIGYSTGGGYANTGLKVYGDGVSATTGFYLAGGAKYNVNGGLVVNTAPTTIRQYGSGLASIGIFDINTNPGLSISAAASGSVLDANIQLVSDGYGMVVTTATGAGTATGDLVINGPLNVGSLGFYKRGTGSVWLNGVATSGNAAIQLQSGTIFCGANSVLGQYATLNTSSGTTLDLKATSQTVAGGTLAGTLRLGLNKANTLPNAQITCLGGSLTLGGTLIVTNLGALPLAAGDNFILFNASTFTGNFSSKTLPVLSAGLLWDSSQLTNNGSITVVAPPTVSASPASTNLVYGNSATLTAVVTGTAPLAVQWYDRNTNLIAGATNVTLALVNPVVAASGNYRVIVTNLYGKATNFSAVTISKAPLTVIANNTNRVYGATNPVFSATFTNWVNGDTAAVLTGAPGLTTAAVTNSPVGSYPIVAAVGTLSATNYSFVFSNGTLAVTGAPLTITASNLSKTYGQNLVFAGTEFSSAGLLNGDTVTNVTLASAGATNLAAVAGYAIVPGSAQGARLTNYSLSYVNGTLTVNPAPLTVLANNTNRVYGATNPVFSATFTNWVNGDTAAVLTGAPGLTTAAVTNSPVGNYAIFAAAGTLSATNYSFVFSNGLLTVTGAPLTITASNLSKTYGQTLVFAGTEFSASGLLNNDTVTNVTLASAGATNTAAAGGYVVTAANAQGTGLTNYTLSYANGTLTVNPAWLTVIADSASRPYGATNPVFTATFTNFLNGDTAAVVGGAPDLTTAATTNSPVGSYAIVAAAGTLSATNYSFMFSNGLLAVTSAPLTITASNLSKTYGQTLVFAGTEFMASGLLNNDTVTNVTLASAGATNTAAAGGYVVTAANAQGSGLTNYTLSYGNGTLTVNPALLTVIANNTSRVYGATNPVFSATFTNWVNGDTAAVLTGAPGLTTAAVTNSPVGSYPIVAAVGTLSATNYSFVFSNGLLAVTSAPLTITASNLSKTYGQTLVFAGTEFSASGLLNNDTVTNVTLASAGATNAAAAGLYDITVTNAQGGGLTNYSVTYLAGTLTVTNATVVIPVITSTAAVGGGGFALSGTGGAGQSYVLVATTNLVVPVWIPVATNVADGAGVFHLTDPGATNRCEFYRVRSP